MAQVLIRNVPEDTIDGYKAKALLKGHSLEQELRDLLERNRPYTPDERVAVSRRHLGRYQGIQPSLTLTNIREGME